MAVRYIIVGRGADCDFVIPELTVSSRHAKLSWQGGALLVEDLGSANGTFVDGKRVRSATIRPGEALLLGSTPFPWSDTELRPFLRRGGGDTVLGQRISGKRFICGRCGARGMMPTNSTGPVACGACGVGLDVKGKAGSTWAAVTVLFLLLGAGLAAWWFVSRGGGEEILEQVTKRTDEALVPVGSAEERSIRVHSVDNIKAAIDATNPTTRNAAVQVASGVEGPFSIEQVAHIWNHTRSSWRYVNDPRGAEYFAKASETIANEYAGDCDDFAITLASMIIAIGGQARIVMMDGPEGGHAYAEACVPEAPEDIVTKLGRYYRRNRNKTLGRQRLSRVFFRPADDCDVWLNLDWNAQVIGGPYEAERWAVAIYPDGRTLTLTPAGQPEDGAANPAAEAVAD